MLYRVISSMGAECKVIHVHVVQAKVQVCVWYTATIVCSVQTVKCCVAS